jgi:hypothetical protein
MPERADGGVPVAVGVPLGRFEGFAGWACPAGSETMDRATGGGPMRKAIAVVLAAIAAAVCGFGGLLVYGLADEYGIGVELVPIVVIVLAVSALLALPARRLYSSTSARTVAMRVDREGPGTAL